MIGQTLGNHKVIAKIGGGGMGAVYLAEHPLLKTRVAIKVLLPIYSDRKDAVDRFFQEAQATALIHHRNLVRIFDLGTHDGQAYIVMEYLQGEDLGARLERVNKLPVVTAIDLGIQVALGLAAAHSRGLVHRDLKPENIFLTPDPDQPDRELVKILDFGIAKLTSPDANASNLTTPGMVMGTPLYMSPEQCVGASAVDQRADIYSLGCVLFAAIVGHPPFHNKDSAVELLTAHLRDTPPLMSSLVPTVPAECDALVTDLLLKNRDDRPKSMSDVAGRMAQIRGSLPDIQEEPKARSTDVLNVSNTPDPDVAVPMALAVGATAFLPDPVDGNGSPDAPGTDDRPIVLHSTTLRASAVSKIPTEENSSATGSTFPNHRKRIAVVGGAAALAVVAALLFSPSKSVPKRFEASAGLQPNHQVSQEVDALPKPVVVSGEAHDEPIVVPKEISSVPMIRVLVKNAREGITASIDGKHARLSGSPANSTRSIMVPDDGQSHVLRFDTPRFKPFKTTVSPGRQAAITIQNTLITF